MLNYLMTVRYPGQPDKNYIIRANNFKKAHDHALFTTQREYYKKGISCNRSDFRISGQSIPITDDFADDLKERILSADKTEAYATKKENVQIHAFWMPRPLSPMTILNYNPCFPEDAKCIAQNIRQHYNVMNLTVSETEKLFLRELQKMGYTARITADILPVFC